MSKNPETFSQKELSAEYMELIKSCNGFKLFLPAHLGGRELPLHEGLSEIIRLSEINASLGWCVNLGSGAGYFYRFFSAETAKKIFSEPNAVIAGSGHANGKAQKTDQGYFITGKWQRCSGAAYATAFTGNAVFEDGKEHSVLFRRNQVELADDWNQFAMKATSSFSYEVKNQFVADEFIFDIGQLKFDDPYRISEIPFEIFARFCMVANLIGSVMCFQNHLENEFAPKLRLVGTDFENLKTKLQSDQSSMLELAKRYWSLAHSESKFTEQHHLNLKNGVALMSRSLFDAVCNLYYKIGIALADESTESHHAFKDVLMASQHGMMK